MAWRPGGLEAAFEAAFEAVFEAVFEAAFEESDVTTGSAVTSAHTTSEVDSIRFAAVLGRRHKKLRKTFLPTANYSEEEKQMRGKMTKFIITISACHFLWKIHA